MITKNAGFTLIELVIVIVILGILAVVAAPRFLDLTSDANTQVIRGMEGAISEASTLIFAKAAIESLQNEASASLDLNNDNTPDIQIRFGYPTANSTDGLPRALAGGLDNDWAWATDPSGSTIFITTANLAGGAGELGDWTEVTATFCYVSYGHAIIATFDPIINTATNGC